MRTFSTRRSKLIWLTGIFILCIIFGAVSIFLVIFPARGSRITHIYKVDSERQLVVDNWDCGATCDFHTKVYVQTETWHGKSKKTLLSCIGVLDVTLTDVGMKSAKIEHMDRTRSTNNCPYSDGDILHY